MKFEFRPPKVLIYDIETSLAKLCGFSLGQAYLRPEHVLEPSRLLCVGYQWLGGDVQFNSEWTSSSHEAMVQENWDLLDEADAVIHFNGSRFDEPWLQTEFLRLGLTPPSPYKTVDLYQTIKHKFRFLSGKLAYVTKNLKLAEKMSNEGLKLWKKVSFDHDPAAQQEMENYCMNDVVILEPLYMALLPWIT